MIDTVRPNPTPPRPPKARRAGRRRWRLGALALTLSLVGLGPLPGCNQASVDAGTSSPRGGRGVELHQNLTIRFTSRLKRLPFDPREIRLREASEQVGQLAGHPIEIVVDVALMPEYEAIFHEELIEALEWMAKDLRDLKERCPACRVYVPRSIEVRYDVSATDSSPYRRAQLDLSRKALTIPIGAHTGLVPQGMLYEVAADARNDALIAKYAGKDPKQIAVADHREYFEYLHGHYTDLQTGARHHEPEADAIHKALVLHELSTDEALRGDIRERDIRRAQQRLTSWYPRGEMSNKGKDGDKLRAARTFGSFLGSNMRRLTPDQKLRVAQTLFVHDEGRGFVADPVPGIDPFEFGLSIIDRWIARGETYEGLTGPELSLTVFITCDRERGHGLGECRDERFYRYAWDIEGGKTRLARALMERKSDTLVRAAMVNIGEPLELLRLLEDDRKTWRAGATAIITQDFISSWSATWVPNEIERLWRERPDDRGLLLFMLATYDPDGRDKEVWNRFSKRFGSSIGPLDLAGFLDFDVRAYDRLDGPMRALGSGWSRAKIFSPRAEALLSDRDGPRYGAVYSMARAMCTNTSKGDRQQLRQRLTRISRSGTVRPSKLESTLKKLSPGGCR